VLKIEGFDARLMLTSAGLWNFYLMATKSSSMEEQHCLTQPLFLDNFII
jgi:hypothetical protein